MCRTERYVMVTIIPSITNMPPAFEELFVEEALDEAAGHQDEHVQERLCHIVMAYNENVQERLCNNNNNIITKIFKSGCAIQSWPT